MFKFCMIKVKIEKTIPSIKVFKTAGDSRRGLWYNGKFYMSLKNIKILSRDKIISAIQLGNSNRFMYTFDKKRRIKGFAPKKLL